ncbi:MAG: hypothetical protein GY906_21940 [bacterium]|nr:hypothetical protein [bacterium]
MRLRPRYPLLFLLALVVASLLWRDAVDKRREHISVRVVRAPLVLVNNPPDLVITSLVQEQISVQLRGPLSQTLQSRDEVEVWLDLQSARPGVQTFRISEADVQVPPEITVVSVDPAELTLEIERLETRSLPVRVPVEGQPAPGFQVSAVRVVPARIAIQGPGSFLEALEEVESTPIAIDGARSMVEGTVQALLPHPLLKPITGVPFLVMIEIIPIEESETATELSEEG